MLANPQGSNLELPRHKQGANSWSPSEISDSRQMRQVLGADFPGENLWRLPNCNVLWGVDQGMVGGVGGLDFGLSLI